MKIGTPNLIVSQESSQTDGSFFSSAVPFTKGVVSVLPFSGSVIASCLRVTVKWDEVSTMTVRVVTLT